VIGSILQVAVSGVNLSVYATFVVQKSAPDNGGFVAQTGFEPARFFRAPVLETGVAAISPLGLAVR
jgi:hypothetical protein